MCAGRHFWAAVMVACGLFALVGLGCGGGGGGGGGGDGDSTDNLPQPQTVQDVNRYKEAATDQEKAAALESIASNCPSMGILDDGGNQLNPGAAHTDVNLRPADLALFTALIEEGSHRTIGDVFAFLEASGVVLADSNQPVSFARVRQQVQDYVDWSFDHLDDPQSTLGVLIAAGPDLTVPASAPTITAGTAISSLTATLVLADILLGVPETDGTDGSAATAAIRVDPLDVEEAARNIEGLMKLVVTFEGFFIDKLTASDKSVYELSKALIGKFALGNQLRVGFLKPAAGGGDDWEVVNTLTLRDAAQTLKVGLVLSPGGAAGDLANVSAPGDLVAYNLELEDPVSGSGEVDYTVVFSGGGQELSFSASIEPDRTITVTTDQTPTSNSRAALIGNASIEIPDFDLDALIDKALAKIGVPFVTNTLMDYIRDNAIKEDITTLVDSFRAVSGHLNIDVIGEPETLDVAITADPQNTFVDDWVFFDSTVTGGSRPYLYRWDFGDNESSTMHDDSHRYSTSGTFTVTLTVTDENGDTASDTLQVTVGDYADEYVVYYTDNVRCWGAPWLYIGSRNKFNSTERRCDQPGGGIDCSQELVKTEIQGGFLTTQAANDWICPKITGAHFSYWCGGARAHWIVDGQELDFRLGNLSCGDLSGVPDVPYPDPHPGM